MEQNDHSYNEPELLQKLVAGSAAAFDALYSRYYEPVRANIYKIVRDDAATDDLLQETFISLWEKRERFKEYARIGGWLFVVSYNRSMNFLRRVATERAHHQSIAGAKQYAEDPGEVALLELQLQLLEEAIAQLPPQRRRVFELCRFGGRTYEQTANELSISKNTVKDHLARASASILAYLQNHPQRSLLSGPAIFFLLEACSNHPF